MGRAGRTGAADSFRATVTLQGRHGVARTPVWRTREFLLSLAASGAWSAVGGLLLGRFLDTGSPASGRLAAYVLWPGQLFDFHTPAVPVPGARVLLFTLAVVAYHLLLLLPWWLPRLAGSRLRPWLGWALVGVHLVASIPVSARTRLLFDLARAVRDL